jgi:hypothetical protein
LVLFWKSWNFNTVKLKRFTVYNFLLQTFKELIDSFLYLFILFGDGVSHWKKTENCIIARSAWCKVSVIFQVITLSPNTQPFKSKFIPYHLITSKHKYYVTKFMFNIFMFCSCTIFCGACVFYDVWAFASQTDFFFNVTQNHPNFSTNCSACCMKN